MPSSTQLREIMQCQVKLMSDGDADGIAALYRDEASSRTLAPNPFSEW